jgi:hypothetical protein
MPSTLAVIATGAIAIYGFLYLILHYTQDAKEPPPVSTSFPFIGTMIGLLRKKSKYYVELRYAYAVCIDLIFNVPEADFRNRALMLSTGTSTIYPYTLFAYSGQDYTSSTPVLSFFLLSANPKH